jgi:hypothetical protein
MVSLVIGTLIEPVCWPARTVMVAFDASAV